MEKKKDCDHESLFECRGRKWWESAWPPLGARTPGPKDKACARCGEPCDGFHRWANGKPICDACARRPIPE